MQKTAMPKLRSQEKIARLLEPRNPMPPITLILLSTHKEGGYHTLEFLKLVDDWIERNLRQYGYDYLYVASHVKTLEGVGNDHNFLVAVSNQYCYDFITAMQQHRLDPVSVVPTGKTMREVFL